MYNGTAYRNGIPKDSIRIDRIQTVIDISVNGRTETFNPEDALEFLMDECGLTYGEANRMLGN